MADHLRPRFRYYVASTPEQIRDHFKSQFMNHQVLFTGSSLKYHIVVDYPETERHYWSPQIDLNLEEYEKGTLIRGLLGPRPAVWTVFMFFYAIAGIAGLTGVIIGAGQWSMKESPIALWLIPLSAIIFIAAYIVGKKGKNIAHNESVTLFNFFIENIENPIELEIDEL